MLKFQESQTIELKLIFKDEYLKTICVFALINQIKKEILQLIVKDKSISYVKLAESLKKQQLL